jgi:hypothetical protein
MNSIAFLCIISVIPAKRFGVNQQKTIPRIKSSPTAFSHHDCDNLVVFKKKLIVEVERINSQSHARIFRFGMFEKDSPIGPVIIVGIENMDH